MKAKTRGSPGTSRQEDLYLYKVEESTHIINSRWRVPFCDRSDSYATAEQDLKKNLLFLSYSKHKENVYNFIDWGNRSKLTSPQGQQKILLINCSEFPSLGPESISQFMAQAYKLGWKKFITFGWQGQEFCGSGLGHQSNDVRIDVYGSPGDALASDLDGAEITVHGSVMNQVGKNMNLLCLPIAIIS